MIHRAVKILLLAVLAPGIFIYAQQKKTAGHDKKAPGLLKPYVYLGNSQFAGGPIKKEVFNDLLSQGLTSHDSSGNKYKVIGFNFGYAERNIYEDSLGNLVAMMDYSNEYCPGDTISTDISKTRTTAIKDYLDGNPDSSDISMSIYARAKPGDTIYFDNVQVVRYINASQTDSEAILAKGFKCWVIK